MPDHEEPGELPPQAGEPEEAHTNSGYQDDDQQTKPAFSINDATKMNGEKPESLLAGKSFLECNPALFR